MLGLAGTGLASPFSFHHKSTSSSSCPSFSGDFNITNYKLYSESSDFDSINCKFYIGSNFNATVMVYDPYTKAQTILTYPNISYTDPSHISGIDFDVRTGSVYFMANSGTPFQTNGTDKSGPNYLIKYNAKTNTTAWIADLNTYTAAVEKRTGTLIGAFQDMAEDTKGNSYAIVTYGNGIAKVSSSGVVSEYYTPSNINATASGFNGVASFGDKLLAVDNIAPAITVFDTAAATAVGTTVNLTLQEGSVLNCDGVYLPPRFDSTVMLCSFDGLGIMVIKSTDGWKSAKHLGTVANNAAWAAQGGLGTNTVQIANSIYQNEEFFTDTTVYDAAGDRTVFPFLDITEQVVSLVNA
ncbi:hypothetical protein N0V95_007666 [Ascochyta clinopodiicola]|nr:hypothetical protein N0V95_007666 [Ascochyta clinopodiicola]